MKHCFWKEILSKNHPVRSRRVFYLFEPRTSFPSKNIFHSKIFFLLVSIWCKQFKCSPQCNQRHCRFSNTNWKKFYGNLQSGSCHFFFSFWRIQNQVGIFHFSISKGHRKEILVSKPYSVIHQLIIFRPNFAIRLPWIEYGTLLIHFSFSF